MDDPARGTMTARWEETPDRSSRHDRCASAESLHRSDEVREIVRLERNGRSRERNYDRSMGGDARQGHPMLKKPQPMTAAPKPHNARKYCEFHKQNSHTTSEWMELKKTFHELVDKGQIDCFLKRGPRSFRKDCDLAREEPREEECTIAIVATIAIGYTEGINRAAWKAQMRWTQQGLTAEQGNRITVPTMTFDGREGQHFNLSHNNPLNCRTKGGHRISTSNFDRYQELYRHYYLGLLEKT
ncbi:hypothetical protein Cgig2_020363 [Carnegiea gigantea]|uniref:Uncharacterized protein n=1 Tax=Carnegiea gigantea TaxID=171969 RepID=A0A9Q1QGA0_9CARY|nr:hypothetical protein Cgig2_020363 [Carnegiea gigantea]